MLDITTLPPTAQIAISELETSKARNRRGIIPLSRSQIRRLEAQGLFPPSRRIAGTKPTTPKKQRPPKPNLTIIGLPTADNTYTFTPLGYFPTKKAAHRAIAEQQKDAPDLIYFMLEDKEAPLYKKMAALLEKAA